MGPYVRARAGLLAGAWLAPLAWLWTVVPAVGLGGRRSRAWLFVVVAVAVGLLPLARRSTLFHRGRSAVFLAGVSALFLLVVTAPEIEPSQRSFDAWVYGCLVLGLLLAHAATSVLRRDAAGGDRRLLLQWLTNAMGRHRLTLVVRRATAPARRAKWRQAAPLYVAAAGVYVLSRAVGDRLAQSNAVTAFAVVAAGTAVLMVAGRRGRRQTALSASELQEIDVRPPVLILRSFRDDRRGRWRLSRSFEETLVGALAQTGPAVAIGEPTEKLPPLGAARHYVGAATSWREVVSALIDQASAVVFVLGDSENLFWEFRTAVERRGFHRLLIVVPPVNGRELRSRWRSLLDSQADLFGTQLTPASVPEHAVAIGFVGGCAAIMGARNRRRSSVVAAVSLFGHLAEAEIGSPGDVRAHLARRAPRLVASGPSEGGLRAGSRPVRIDNRK